MLSPLSHRVPSPKRIFRLPLMIINLSKYYMPPVFCDHACLLVVSHSSGTNTGVVGLRHCHRPTASVWRPSLGPCAHGTFVYLSI